MTEYEIITRLTDLRRELEIETGALDPTQTLLLTDVCRSLGLNEIDAELVVGTTYHVVSDNACLRANRRLS